MATPPTAEDYIETAIREGLARPTRITRTIAKTDGSQVQLAFAATAAMAERAGSYAQGELNESRLRTALSVSVEALERYGASELGGEIRRGASASIVPLSWSRDPGGAAVTILAGSLVSTTGGVTFTTSYDLPFVSGEVGPKLVDGIATTAGAGGNVAKGTIINPLGSIPDPTLTVTNLEPASGGLPADSPEDYQAQLETAYERARRGTLGAIEAAASLVEGVVSARVYELLNGDCLSGRVIVQILGGGGTTNSSLANRVREVLREFRAAGVPTVVEALNPVVIEFRAYGLIILPGFDEATVLQQARSSAVAEVDDLTVGATLRLASITGVWQEIDGLDVPKGALVLPADDVTPVAGSYSVTTLDSVFVTTDPEP